MIAKIFCISYPFATLTLAMYAFNRPADTSARTSESIRKLIHIGMGLLALPLPLLLDSNLEIFIASALTLVWLLCVRKVPALYRHFGGGLFAVDRTSWGDIYFALAIATLLIFSNGNWLLYSIPVLILTFADSMAAIVGSRIKSPRLSFTVEPKTVAGSATFFVVAVVCCYAVLHAATDLDSKLLLILSLSVGALTTVAEALSSRGADNLTVPLSAFGILFFFQLIGWL